MNLSVTKLGLSVLASALLCASPARADIACGFTKEVRVKDKGGKEVTMWEAWLIVRQHNGNEEEQQFTSWGDDGKHHYRTRERAKTDADLTAAQKNNQEIYLYGKRGAASLSRSCPD